MDLETAQSLEGHCNVSTELPRKVPLVSGHPMPSCHCHTGIRANDNSLDLAPCSSRNCPEWHISLQTHEKTSWVTSSRCQDTSGPWEPSCPSSGDINVHFLTDHKSLCSRNEMEIPKCWHLELTLRDSAQCRAGAPLLHNPAQFHSHPHQSTERHSRVALLPFSGVWSFILALRTGNFVLSRQNEPWLHQGESKCWLELCV